jgi:hypothetical protein
MGEVGRVADAGTPVEVIDQAFMGFAPMPPFVLLGLVGPAIALHNGETLIKAFPDRFYVSEGLKAIVEAKQAGLLHLCRRQAGPRPRGARSAPPAREPGRPHHLRSANGCSAPWRRRPG